MTTTTTTTTTCPRCGIRNDLSISGSTSSSSSCTACGAQPAHGATGARNDDSVLFSLATLREVTAPAARSVSTASPATAAVSSASAVSRPAASRSAQRARAASAAVDQILTVGCATVSPLGPVVLNAPAPETPTPSSRRANRSVVLASAAAAVLVVQGAVAAAVLTRPTPSTPRAPAAASSAQIAARTVAPVTAPVVAPLTSARVAVVETAPELPTVRPGHPLAASERPTVAHTPVASHPHVMPLGSLPLDSLPRPTTTTTTSTATTSAARCVATCRGNAECLMRCSVGTPLAIPAAPPESTTPAHATPERELPAAPTRPEVLAALAAVRAPVQRCADGRTGLATVSVTFAGSGRVTTATVASPWAGTPEGSCIARAVRSATLPAFSRASFTVTYPFSIQ